VALLLSSVHVISSITVGTNQATSTISYLALSPAFRISGRDPVDGRVWIYRYDWDVVDGQVVWTEAAECLLAWW
jgi:hypothetical protein